LNSSRAAKICWCIDWKKTSAWRLEQLGLLTFGRKLHPVDGCSLGTRMSWFVEWFLSCGTKPATISLHEVPPDRVQEQVREVRWQSSSNLMGKPNPTQKILSTMIQQRHRYRDRDHWHNEGVAPLFFHDDNNSCLEAGQAGSDIKCWWELLIRVGGRSMRLWHRANDGLAGLAF
jgi:hypothetical protein